MTNKVIAIGLDGTDPLLLEKWVGEGSLPNFAKFFEQGGYTRLKNSVEFLGENVGISATEPSWVAFSSGCLPGTTGYWDITTFDPETYQIDSTVKTRPYDFEECPAFFDLGPDVKVCTFDLPVWVPSEKINGPQVMGWGGHFSAGERQSHPKNLLKDLQDRFGECNVFDKDHGAIWDAKYMDWIETELKASIGKRGNIMRHLLKEEAPDLFIGVFPEGHSAGHDLLMYTQDDHPVHADKKMDGKRYDPMLTVYQAIDAEIGKILDEKPEDATLMLFSVHGMDENHSDVLTMAFLPELMYRYSFPGKAVLPAGDITTAPGPVIKSSRRGSWPAALWTEREDSNPLMRMLRPWLPGRFLKKDGDSEELQSPYSRNSSQLNWMPATWYQQQWPKMKAFGLPTFWEGRIRINVKGRDGDGVVDVEDYDAVCKEVSDVILRLKDPRSGQPIAHRVLRTRRTALDNDPKLPDFDLIVDWNDRAVDVMDSPDVGRIGPVPFMRSGSHRPRGLAMAIGPSIAAGSELRYGSIVDLAPSVLSLLGAAPRSKLDGESLFVEGGTSATRKAG